MSDRKEEYCTNPSHLLFCQLDASLYQVIFSPYVSVIIIFMRVMYRMLRPANSYSFFGRFDPVPRVTLMMKFHSISSAVQLCKLTVILFFGRFDPVPRVTLMMKFHSISSAVQLCKLYTKPRF